MGLVDEFESDLLQLRSFFQTLTSHTMRLEQLRTTRKLELELEKERRAHILADNQKLFATVKVHPYLILPEHSPSS
jgi:hypothetical protein